VVVDPRGEFKLGSPTRGSPLPHQTARVEWLVPLPHDPEIQYFTPPVSVRLPFQAMHAKMATGSGKTIVMAVMIAWHILNKVA
jgi:hypothetical protein